MNKHTVTAIEAKMREIWIDETPQVNAIVRAGHVSVKIESAHESPGLSFAKLKAVAEFFGTNSVSEESFENAGDCDTCDYGSSYGFTLTIRP